jgi:hypothetical protein
MTMMLMGAGTGVPAQVLVYDSFTESLSDTDLASHVPDVGGPWTATVNDFTVGAANDLVYVPSHLDTSLVAIVNVPPVLYSVSMSFVLNFLHSGGSQYDSEAAIYFRYGAAVNHYEFKLHTANGWSYTRIISGIPSGSGGAYAVTNGGVYTLSVNLSNIPVANQITCFINGVQIFQTTSTPLSAQYTTGFGMMRQTNSNVNTITGDEFRVTRP